MTATPADFRTGIAQLRAMAIVELGKLGIGPRGAARLINVSPSLAGYYYKKLGIRPHPEPDLFDTLPVELQNMISNLRGLS